MTSLLISDVFPPKVGGSGRWFWELYRRLPRDEYALAVGQDPGQEAFDRTHDLRLARVPLPRPNLSLRGPEMLGSYRRAWHAVGQIVRQERITRVHAARALPEGFIALLLKWRYGLPYLCYVLGEEVQLMPAPGGGGMMSSRQLRWMTRVVLGGAECLIACSRNTASILRDQWHLPAERIQVLHPGVDTARFAPAARDPAVRARLGWGERPVVLTVSRLQRRKGHDQMILAIGRIRQAIPDVLYAIVGDGEERPALEALVAREGLGDQVQLLGEMDDDALVRCYQQCDLFVLPNRQVGRDVEGFGIVLLEAQACGKPVVAGASGGTAETMRIPETGLVVRCDGPHELAALVAELLADPGRLDRMGRAARRWAVEQFDWPALSLQARRVLAGRVPCAS